MKKSKLTYTQVLLLRPAGVFLVAVSTAVAILGITTGFNIPTETQAQTTPTSSHVIINRTPTPIPTATASATLQVTIKPNQTFWEISRKYCGSHTFAQSIAKNNGYESFSRLRTGAVLTITCTQ